MDSVSKITFGNASFRIQKPNSELGFSTCIHAITYVMFFPVHIPAFIHLCILLKEKKHRNAFFVVVFTVFPVLLLISTILISNTCVVLKYVDTESVPCHLRAKMFQSLLFTECDVGPYC